MSILKYFQFHLYHAVLLCVIRPNFCKIMEFLIFPIKQILTLLLYLSAEHSSVWSSVIEVDEEDWNLAHHHHSRDTEIHNNQVDGFLETMISTEKYSCNLDSRAKLLTWDTGAQQQCWVWWRRHRSQSKWETLVPTYNLGEQWTWSRHTAPPVDVNYL